MLRLVEFHWRKEQTGFQTRRCTSRRHQQHPGPHSPILVDSCHCLLLALICGPLMAEEPSIYLFTGLRRTPVEVVASLGFHRGSALQSTLIQSLSRFVA